MEGNGRGPLSMHIEAFSAAKNPAAEEANEDALLILPNRAFAAIDGVSDRTGIRYDGMLAGRYASRLLQRRLTTLLGTTDGPIDALAILADLTATIEAAYRHFGTLEQVRQDWSGKIASTLALVLVDAETVQLLLVGDSGARINGTTIYQESKPLDLITALLRRHAWRILATRTTDGEIRERLSRQIAFHGAAQPAEPLTPWLTPTDLATIAAQTQAACAQALPTLPADVVETLIARGIVHGQGGHQNNPTSPLGYSALDGFPIPPQFIRHQTWPRPAIHTIELFTDGYFRPAETFGVTAWETAFAEVEAEDPAKVDRYLSPKGSHAGLWADDRSYLGVRL